MQWADDSMNFPTLLDTMVTQFGDRYIYAEWKDIFTSVFDVSESGEGSLVVKTAMDARGLAFTDINPTPDPSTSASKNVLTRRVKRKFSHDGPSSQDGGVQTRRPSKRVRPTVCRTSYCIIMLWLTRIQLNRFLDIEAQVENESESSDGETERTGK